MRVFLIGSKELSCLILDALIEQGHEVLGVFSRDSEPSMKVWHDLNHRNLSELAKKNGIPFYENMKVNSPESLSLLTRLNLDVIFSCFWSEIFKEPILNIPKLGVYNFHTAFLPLNRGCRPIPWAIIHGEKFCGITLHRMMTGVDNGPIVSQKKVEITNNDTAKTVYDKVISAGGELVKEVLPQFADNSFTLTLQDETQTTYHPRGEPFGRRINPFWDDDLKKRFIRAFDFPPFEKAMPEPINALDGISPRLYVMLGFDCDRPRGTFAFEEEGKKIADKKIESLRKIKAELDDLNIKRTYFICGSFLESMAILYGKNELNTVFSGDLVERGDHTYNHDILKPLPTRPDKKALTHKELQAEIRRNTEVFNTIFDNSLTNRGLRSPLGYYKGMDGQHKSLDVLVQEGMSYISTDLRDENHSLHPKLFNQEGKIRQPYRYENGLLEIPATGWQDTVFSGLTKTPVFENFPTTFDAIINYYKNLFIQANQEVKRHNRDIFLGLTLHPLDNAYYNENRAFFPQLASILHELDGKFITYGEVATHFK
jgi:methionyl-tRNA formyltransferase